MNVVGIDVSTKAIDLVKLPFDGNHAEWTRIELPGDTPATRAGLAPDLIPIGSYWDDVALVAIERPYGPGRDVAFALHVVVGIVIAKLPRRLRPPWLLRPTEWRKACGLSGKATKERVAEFATWETSLGAKPVFWPQDACDAYCIAYAARAINAKGTVAA